MDLMDSEWADPNQRFAIFMTSDGQLACKSPTQEPSLASLKFIYAWCTIHYSTVLFITAQHLGAWCDSVPGESSGSTLYWPSWCCRALLSYYDGSRTHTLTVYDMFMTGQRKHLLAMCVGESPTKIYFKEIWRSSLPHSSFPSFNLHFVFDFFRLLSFQVLLLDIFGGFIMAVASEARSIEDRSWQIELTLWVDSLMLRYLHPWSQGCRYSFRLVRLQGFAKIASVLLQGCFGVWLVEIITEWLDGMHLLDHFRV